MLDAGEECDDHNVINGDGCSSTCHFEPGTTCASAIAVSVALGTQQIQGTTVGGGSHTAGTDCVADAKDRIYALTATANGFLTLVLPRETTSFDSILYLSKGCDDTVDITTLICADSFDPQNSVVLKGGEVLSIKVNAGETYYALVDGFVEGDVGTYTLGVDLSTGVDCTDPIPFPIWPGTAMLALGDTLNTTATTGGSCGGSSMEGLDVVYQVTPHGVTSITFDTDANYTDFNSVLYARSTCGEPNSQLSCGNNPANGGGDQITLFNVPPDGGTFVWVDGSPGGSGGGGLTPAGSYGLYVTP